jgi:hypothetical protein
MTMATATRSDSGIQGDVAAERVAWSARGVCSVETRLGVAV